MVLRGGGSGLLHPPLTQTVSPLAPTLMARTYMKNSTFRPRYSLRNFWDAITLGLLLLSTNVFSYLKTGFSPMTIFGSIFLLPLVVWVLHLLIRHIVFSPSSFYVEKYIWPSKRIKYSDIIDFGNIRIKTRNGDVILAGMSNAPELIEQFNKLMEQGKIDKDQIENKLVREEATLRKSILPAFAVSFLLSALVLYFWPYRHPVFNDGGIWLFLFGMLLTLLGIFLVVLLVVQWIIKKAGYRQIGVSRMEGHEVEK